MRCATSQSRSGYICAIHIIYYCDSICADVRRKDTENVFLRRKNTQIICVSFFLKYSILTYNIIRRNSKTAYVSCLQFFTIADGTTKIQHVSKVQPRSLHTILLNTVTNIALYKLTNASLKLCTTDYGAPLTCATNIS